MKIAFPEVPQVLLQAVEGETVDRVALLDWRDRTVGYINELGRQSNAGNSVATEDRNIAREIKKFIATRTSGLSPKERLDEGFFFWDVCAAALDAGAKKTCSLLLQRYQKDRGVGENFLQRAFEADAGYALPLLLKNGWEEQWKARSQGWDSVCWSRLARTCRDWMRENRPEEVLSTDLDTANEDVQNAFDFQWASLAEGITLVTEDGDLKSFQRRLDYFVEGVGEELVLLFKNTSHHKKLASAACENLAWNLMPSKASQVFDLEARIDAADYWWERLSTQGLAARSVWDEGWLASQESLIRIDDQWGGVMYKEALSKWQARRDRVKLLERHADLKPLTPRRVAL